MLTMAEVDALAPDAAAAASGRSLAQVRKWARVGRDDSFAWGEIQGSALYQVRAELSSRAARCTCPSRKLPCKHSLGLLYLVATEAAPVAEAPGWLVDWQKQRAAKAAPKAAPAPTPDAVDRRVDRMGEAVTMLWRQLMDRARHGFAELDAAELEAWAVRLVDQKAGGLAGRVRALATLDEDARLREIGRLVLICAAYERRDTLDPLLRADLFTALGIPVLRDVVLTTGEAVTGRWHHVGRTTEEDDALTTTRDLLVNDEGRAARVIQYTPPGRALPDALWPGGSQMATLCFYPSAAPDRALILNTAGDLRLAAPPTLPSLDALADRHVDTLARVPWRTSTAGMVRGLRVDPGEGMWLVDSAGAALPLRRANWWLCAAACAGPLTLALEWDGERVDVVGRMG